jgi:hypothetical protein
MTLESEALLLLDDAFAKFKQSHTEVTQTLETIKLSFSKSSTVPIAPPKELVWSDDG